MDTLSLILDDIRLKGAVFRQYELAQPWAMRLETPGLSSFHIVTRGQAWLLRDGEPPLMLQFGDLVLLPRGIDHRVQDSPEPGAAPRDMLPDLDSPSDEPLRLGDGAAATGLLSGYFRFEVELARPLMAALPQLLHLRSLGSSPPVWLRVGLEFIADEFSRPRPARQAIVNRIADILLMEFLRHHVESLPEGSGNWLLRPARPSLVGGAGRHAPGAAARLDRTGAGGPSLPVALGLRRPFHPGAGAAAAGLSHRAPHASGGLATALRQPDGRTHRRGQRLCLGNRLQPGLQAGLRQQPQCLAPEAAGVIPHHGRNGRWNCHELGVKSGR